jgi:hypothetical protein
VRQPADLIKVNEDLSLDKPLHVIYKASKLAYRICVILIANESVKKKLTLGISFLAKCVEQKFQEL